MALGNLMQIWTSVNFLISANGGNVNLAGGNTADGTLQILWNDTSQINDWYLVREYTDMQHMIINGATGTALTSVGTGTNAQTTGDKIDPSNPNAAQLWYFNSVAGGYAIESVAYPGYVLDVQRAVTDLYTPIITYEWHNGTNQVWNLNQIGHF